jgi:hypothetical protein
MRNRIITLAATGLAAAALSLAGMAGASASTHPKSNATLVCGFSCFNLSNLQLDATGTGSFIQNAVGGATGTSINMRGAGIAKTNQDFQAAFNTFVGSVADPGTACGNGLLAPTSIFCLHFNSFVNDLVVESNFAPNSNQTGLCVGNQVANVAGRLALAPCGASPTTTWVIDTANFFVIRHGHVYAGWLNGADTNFSHPLALTVNPSSKSPKNVLRTDQENLTANFLPDTQLFTFTIGHANA